MERGPHREGSGQRDDRLNFGPKGRGVDSSARALADPGGKGQANGGRRRLRSALTALAAATRGGLMADALYIGRLAPSPTGRYHLGNLSTALLAQLRALRSGGRLIYRLEDLDGPREAAGSAASIADDLRWLGIDWSEGPDRGGPCAPYIQSQRLDRYAAAVAQLEGSGHLYRCTCSRKEIAEVLSAPHGSFPASLLYPGTCRARTEAGDEEPHALRFCAGGLVVVEDALAAPLVVDTAADPGDAIVRRRDGCFAYHLAVVVDDLAMGVSEVVRGRDLLSSTALHMQLAAALGRPYPATCHVPMIVDAIGARLAKRDGALGRLELEAVGYTPALLRGAFACLWGFADRLEALSVEELATLWRDEALRADALNLHPAMSRGPEALRLALSAR